MITPEEIAHLRKLAEAATPGEWHHGHFACNDPRVRHLDEVAVYGGRSVVNWSGFDQNSFGKEQGSKDAAFIAGFNPVTAKRLLDEVEALRARAEGAEKERDEAVRLIKLIRDGRPEDTEGYYKGAVKDFLASMEKGEP